MPMLSCAFDYASGLLRGVDGTSLKRDADVLQ